MRRSRSSMHNQQRLAPSQRNVVNHHAIGVDEAILQRIDVSNPCGGVMNRVFRLSKRRHGAQSSRTGIQTLAIDKHRRENARVFMPAIVTCMAVKGNGPRKILGGEKEKTSKIAE